MTVHKYRTPVAFKAAVEQRLKNEAARTGKDLQRLRQVLVFDRYLTRLFAIFDEAIVLKGGFGLEMRV